jgi:uncharacterized protein
MTSSEDTIKSFVKDTLSGPGHGAHTYDHTLRVYSIALVLGETLGANEKVLGAAALLHDIGRPQEAETGISHAILSGEMSRELLSELDYSDQEIEQVVEAIRTHRFSDGLEPTSLEGEILSDADKLDAMGAIGVFRAIAQTNGTGVGVAGFLRHAEEKLLKLKDLMHTEPARRMAKKRHHVLETFVEELRADSGHLI